MKKHLVGLAHTGIFFNTWFESKHDIRSDSFFFLKKKRETDRASPSHTPFFVSFNVKCAKKKEEEEFEDRKMDVMFLTSSLSAVHCFGEP